MKKKDQFGLLILTFVEVHWFGLYRKGSHHKTHAGWQSVSVAGREHTLTGLEVCL